MRGALTTRERQDLGALIRRHEKLAKTAATQRAAELLADFERQLDTQYGFDSDETWRDAHTAATKAVQAAQEVVAARCAELGIPKAFAPTISGVSWFGRGQNAIKERRAELRRIATTRIDALRKAAVTQIEAESVRLQTEVVTTSLTSDHARAFLDRLPVIEQLMRPLEAKDLIENLSRVRS